LAEQAQAPAPGADGGGARTGGIVVLATLAIIGALYVGREFFVPVAFAFLLNALFRPVVRVLNRRAKLPAPAAAAAVVLGLLGVLALAGYGLSGPIKEWVAKAPGRFDAAEQKLSRLRQPIQQVQRVTQKLEHATDFGGAGADSQPMSDAASQPAAPATQPSAGPASPPPAAPANAKGAGKSDGARAQSGASDPAEPKVGESTSGEQPPAPPPPQVPAPAGPGIAGRFLGTTTSLVGGITEVLVLLYLLLAADDLFFRKLLKVMPTVRDKKTADEVVDEAQGVVMRYLWVTLLINLGQATVIGLVLWWLGMPSPLMWALLTVVLEFIPYLGAAIMIVLLSVVAFATFDSLGRILAVPGSYLLVTTLQNNIVSPLAYGDRLKLNPVAVLLGVVFWWYVWGTPGAFLAVPLIATIKIVTCRIDRFAPVGEFLSE
jgi:predicted PurR-regulated permease PerM